MIDGSVLAPDAAGTAPGPEPPQGAGQALFNPFATIGVVLQPAVAPAPAPPPGEADWSLPLAWMVAGVAWLVLLIRKIVG